MAFRLSITRVACTADRIITAVLMSTIYDAFYLKHRRLLHYAATTSILQ